MTNEAPSPFQLNPDLDAAECARLFAKTGIIQITGFLVPDIADRLRSELEDSAEWRRIINGGDKIFEIAPEAYAALPPQEREKLEASVLASAASGFQFRYETIRVSDERDVRRSSARLLDGFAEFMCAEPTIAFFRTITGIDDIGFADAQATRYQPGDFLTSHDDNVEGKNRRLAYVLGLTPGWKAEWGGLLHFTDEESISISQSIVPRFNALSLFSIPQRHHVGCVAPYAPVPRTSITGWFRIR